MDNSLLLSIREEMLQGKPLQDLLRSCIFLGGDAGAVELKEWARKELEGYELNDEVPGYRTLRPVTVYVTLRAGNQILSDLPFPVSEFPKDVRKFYPREWILNQSISEIDEYVRSEHARFQSHSLVILLGAFNRENWPGREILYISVCPGTAFLAGLLDKVRTKLALILSDMTSSSPMKKMPSANQMNQTVQQHIHNNYQTSIEKANGPIAIGNSAVAEQYGVSSEEIARLLQPLWNAIEDLPQEQKEETEPVVKDIEAQLKSSSPDLVVLEEKKGKLLEAAKSIGLPTFISAVGGVAQALSTLIATGAFGG